MSIDYDERRVDETEVNGYRVSTVRLTCGTEYETMVFGDKDHPHEIMTRTYANRIDAHIGHNEVVQLIKDGKLGMEEDKPGGSGGGEYNPNQTYADIFRKEQYPRDILSERINFCLDRLNQFKSRIDEFEVKLQSLQDSLHLGINKCNLRIFRLENTPTDAEVEQILKAMEEKEGKY